MTRIIPAEHVAVFNKAVIDTCVKIFDVELSYVSAIALYAGTEKSLYDFGAGERALAEDVGEDPQSPVYSLRSQQRTFRRSQTSRIRITGAGSGKFVSDG